MLTHDPLLSRFMLLDVELHTTYLRQSALLATDCLPSFLLLGKRCLALLPVVTY